MQGTDTAAGSNGFAPEVDLPEVILEITRGRAKHKTREVGSTAFLIGTAPDCDLVLGDPRFDPVYCYVLVRPGLVTVRQLGDGPALCVDKRPTSCAVLMDGSRLQLGSYEFEVRIEWPEEGADTVSSTAGTNDAVALPVDRELVARRLLRDVEAYSPAPRLSLFVGDEECETAGPAPIPSPVDSAAWRQSQIRAQIRASS